MVHCLPSSYFVQTETCWCYSVHLRWRGHECFEKWGSSRTKEICMKKICKSCKMLDTAIGLHSNQTHFQGRNARVNGLFWRWPQQNIQEWRSKFWKDWQKQTSGLHSTLQIRKTVEDGTFQLIEMDHISGSHRDSLSLHGYHNQRTCDAPLVAPDVYSVHTICY